MTPRLARAWPATARLYARRAETARLACHPHKCLSARRLRLSRCPAGTQAMSDAGQSCPAWDALTLIYVRADRKSGPDQPERSSRRRARLQAEVADLNHQRPQAAVTSFGMNFSSRDEGGFASDDCSPLAISPCDPATPVESDKKLPEASFGGCPGARRSLM